MGENAKVRLAYQISLKLPNKHWAYKPGGLASQGTQSHKLRINEKLFMSL